MRILHVVRQFYPCIGGVENFVVCLAKEQVADGHSVSVLTLDRSYVDNRNLPRKEKYNGISITRIPFWGSKKYPIAPFCLKHIRDTDIVHIHCVDFFVDYLSLFRFFHKKKIILHTHGGFFHTRWFLPFKIIYFNTITRLSLNTCDRIIADSKHDYNLFKSLSPNVIQIDNGVDTDKYENLKKNIEKNSLMYVGRIDEHKGIEDLIKTVVVLVKQGVEVNLKIIGPDWRGLAPQLIELSRRSGIEKHIHFVGKVTDEQLLEEMSRAKLFISASKYEAFGISAVEALASGTPCVLNSIESFKQFLDGQNCGLLTDFSKPEEAADAIAKILNLDVDTYNTICVNAKENAKRYSWSIVAKKIFMIYEEVTNKH